MKQDVLPVNSTGVTDKGLPSYSGTHASATYLLAKKGSCSCSRWLLCTTLRWISCEYMLLTASSETLQAQASVEEIPGVK